MKAKTKTKTKLLNEVARLRKRKKGKAAQNKKAKTVLLPLSELCDLLSNSSHDEIFVYEYRHQAGVSCKILEVNEVACRQLGYTREELLQKSPYDIYTPETTPHIDAMMKKNMKQKYTMWKGIHLAKNGKRIPVEVHNYLFEMKDKSTVISVVRDNTFPKRTKEAQKQIEEALKNEKAFLDALMDNIPDSIYFKDRQCRILRVNRKEMQDLNVADMNQVIGKTDEDLYGKEFGRSTILSEQGLMESGKPVIGLVETRKLKDGQLNWTSTTKVPLRNNDGKIIGLVGITREINDLMKAQEDRERERVLLRTLIDNLPDYIYVKDYKGRFIVGNNAVVKSFGFSSEEKLIGKTDFDLFPYEQAEQYRAYEQEILRSGSGIYDFEGSAVDQSKKEKERWVSTTKVPYRDVHGKVIGTVGIGRDITERKRMEEVLRETADKFQFVFNNAYDGLSIFEETTERTERKLVDCNKRYAEMAGRSREELLRLGTTQNISRRLSEDNHRFDVHNIAISGSFSWIRPDGKDNVVEYTAVPIKVQGKTITIGIDRDITERKRIEEEREHLIKELQDALADVKTLSGLVPICANCKQIRDDQGFWMQVESYIQERSQARFSHGICPDCMKKLYPEFLSEENE